VPGDYGSYNLTHAHQAIRLDSLGGTHEDHFGI